MTQTKSMTPKEFSAALESHGIQRTARWVRRQGRLGRIHTLAIGAERLLLISAGELARILSTRRELHA